MMGLNDKKKEYVSKNSQFFNQFMSRKTFLRACTTKPR